MLSDYGASADVIIGARFQAWPLAFVRDEAGRHTGVGQEATCDAAHSRGSVAAVK